MALTIPLFALRKGGTSGLESAIFNLMKGIRATGRELRVAHSDPDYLPPAVRNWIEANRIPAKRFPALGAAMAARFIEESIYGLLDRAESAFFPNYHLPPATPRIGQCSVLIHDLQHKALPENFTRSKIAWLDRQFSRSLAKADHVFFISDFEREQAVRWFGSAFERRASVIYNAIDWQRLEGASAEDGPHPCGGRPYLLSVAQHYPHKRLDLLIRAFGILAARQRDLALVLVGRATPGLIALANSELSEDIAARIVFTGFVSDAELGRLYRGAELFALPSAYEGFGMPAVEALCLGRPALLVDAAAIPEVTMGFAHYLAPSAGPGEWAGELEQMIVNPRPVSEDQIGALRNRYDPAAVANALCRALAG